MSNNYRHFLFSPSSASKLRQQTGPSGSDHSLQAQEMNYNSNSMADNKHNTASSRQRLAAAVTGRNVEYLQPQQSAQAANYCQSQIQANLDSSRYTNGSGNNPAEHRSIQPDYTSAQGNRFRVRAIAQPDDELSRRQQQQQVGRHYVRQVNGVESAQQPRSWHQQPEHTARSNYNYNNNNSNNSSGLSHQHQNFICDKNQQHRYYEIASYDDAGGELSTSDDITYHLDQEEQLSEKMAKLLSKNPNSSRSGQSTSAAGLQMAAQTLQFQNFDDEDNHQYADQLRRSQFNQYTAQQRTTNINSASNPNPSQQHQQYSMPSSAQNNNNRPTHHLQSLKQTNQQQQLPNNDQRTSNYHHKEETTSGDNSNVALKKDQPDRSCSRSTSNEGDQQRSLHVNFNRRSSHQNESDNEEECGTRKKKYLTAKYGQQQMNLIKKRLKVEMWLHEQLQELAKQSKTADPEKVDEIDIDLDQLLDMESDAMRHQWLRETLEILNDIPEESIERFINDVLEQSRLL